MSIRVMTSVWDDPDTQTHSELLVLLALADWANDDGYCWPTISALAAKSRLSERAVQQILARLTTTGRIERISGGGRGHANEYRVLITKKPEAETVNQIHRKQNTESKTPNGIQPLGVKRVNLTAEKGELGAPHTSYTRQKNNTTTSSLGSNDVCSSEKADGSSSRSSLAEDLRKVYGLSNSQQNVVLSFLESHGEDYVRAKWAIVQSQPRRNGAGALLAALQDDWQVPVGPTQTNGPPDKDVRLAVAEVRARERGWTW
jgi:hypothetical protein